MDLLYIYNYLNAKSEVIAIMRPGKETEKGAEEERGRLQRLSRSRSRKLLRTYFTICVRDLRYRRS